MNAAPAGKPRGVRSLMTVSLLLLAGFLSQWLYTAYITERSRLGKDLRVEFQALQSELTDSILQQEFIGPALNGSKTVVKVMFHSTDSLKEPTRIRKLIDREQKFVIDGAGAAVALEGPLDSLSVKTQTGGISRSVVLAKGNGLPAMDPNIRSSLPSDSTLSIIKHALSLLIDTLGTRDLRQKTDSLFAERVQQRLADSGYHFETIIITGDTVKKGILITTDNDTRLQVTDYNWYLFRKILPQLLFAVLLLGITSTAFWLMLRSMREQQRLSTMKTELISNMTHELKTPITTVKIALEALDNFRMIEDTARTKDYLRMAGSEIERLDLLVNQALNTSLLESGQIHLQQEPADVSELIRQTLSALQLKLRQNNTTVNFDTEGTGFTALIDKLHFQGVLVNLLDNSMKYAPAAPQINIRLQERGDSLKLDVADNGPGIPDKYLDKVFDQFFRVPTGNVHNTRGYGLGLSYARQVIAQHGGTLSVRNNRDGGCTFTITFNKQS